MEAFKGCLGNREQWMMTGQGLSQVFVWFPLTLRALGGGGIPRCLGDHAESDDSASLPESATGKVV